VERRIAVVAALPPDGGEHAAINCRLVEELARRPGLAVQAFADRPADAGWTLRQLETPAGVPVHPLAALDAVEDFAGPFDDVVYLLADDAHHTGSLAALRRRRGGIVVAHDAYLAGLYGHAERTGALHEGLGAVARAAYGDLVASGFDADRPLPGPEARRLGILLCRDAAAHCRLLLASPTAAALARLDARAPDRPKIIAVPDDPVALADRIYELLPAAPGWAGSEV
jgi:hypothetical protein